MYKIYLNDNVLVIDDDAAKYDKNIIIDENFTVSQVGRTKLLQKLQNTKRTVLLCSGTDEIKEKILSLFRIVPAAGGVVRNNNGDILMIRRLGRWDLPKGKKENNEDSRSCAVREVEEECGINGVIAGEFITETCHLYELNGEWIAKPAAWYSMNYHGSEQLIPQLEENITEVKWIPQHEIKQYKEDTYPTIADVLNCAGL
ncbi:MAG: NUDIX domain-containing protein [Rikenellaceae bacterium]|nr:NUDIX domain-containing protein [Rikenellaceae bacterium]